MTNTTTTKEFLWVLTSRDGALLGSGWAASAAEGTQAGVDKLSALKRAHGTVIVRKGRDGAVIVRTKISLKKGA